MNRTIRLLAWTLALLIALSSWAYAVQPVGRSVPDIGQTDERIDSDTLRAQPEPGDLPAETDPPEPDPTVTTEPEEPDPTEPTEPEEPDPTVTTEPEEPDPTEPTEPEEPDPTDPTDPEEPDPTDPTDPEDPDPEDKPLSEMTDEELIEKFNIPDNWAREALIFAARYQILTDRDGRGLRPTDAVTRAEVAAGLMQVLQTSKAADVSAFTDVNESDWFYYDMARAFALDIFNGYDEHTMGPNYPITREQAFVVIGRLLGVRGNSRQAVYDFPDWRSVSDWAAVGVAAMIDSDFIHGDDTGLNPLGNISRQEFAQVMVNIFDKVSNEETGAFTGDLALAADEVPAGLTVDGSLLLSNDMTSMTVEGLTVNGRMVVQGNGRIVLKLKNCTISNLVLCRDAQVICENCTISKVTANAVNKIKGTFPVVDVYGTLILDGGSTVQTVNMMADGSSMTVAAGAVANTVNVLGKDVYINGNGHIDQLVVHKPGLTNRCDTGSTVEQLDKTMADVTGTRTDNETIEEGQSTHTMGLKLTGMPAGKQDSTVTWYVDGVQIQQSRLLTKEGTTLTATFNFSRFMANRTSVPIRVVVQTKESGKYQYDGIVSFSLSIATQAAQIRTQNVQAVINRTTGLYSYYTKGSDTYTGLIRELTSGIQVTVLEVSDGKAAKVKLPDGTVGWINTYHKDTIQINYYTTTDYSKEVKEYYVNKVRNCTSNTNYLIWVSLYTQRVNIFQGSKGKWKLIRTGPIASGTNYNPTPVEVTKLLYTTPQWTYAAFYCHHVTVFDAARGFHSRPTKYDADGGGIYDATIGRPASHGCIRLLDEDCIFIYKLPLGTAVYIY